MKDIRIERISAEEYDEGVKQVVREGLGKSYSESVKSLDEKDSVLLVAYSDGEPVGFACGYNHKNPEDYIDKFNDSTNANSILEKIAVLPEYRGIGLGTKLYKKRLEILEQPTIAESWIRTEDTDSTALLEKFGFERIQYIEDRWLSESRESNDDDFCPDCGRICRCDSAVYLLEDYSSTKD